MQYVLSRLLLRPAIAERNAAGVAIRFHELKTAWFPELLLYCHIAQIKEDRGVRNWALCQVLDDIVIPVDAFLNPNNIKLNPTRGRLLTSRERSDLDLQIASTDIGVTTQDGDTFDDVVDRIVVTGLRHTSNLTRR